MTDTTASSELSKLDANNDYIKLHLNNSKNLMVRFQLFQYTIHEKIIFIIHRVFFFHFFRTAKKVRVVRHLQAMQYLKTNMVI